MGLFERLFGRRVEAARYAGERFRLLNGYTPVFTTWQGSIYESELIRAAIDAHARHAAKLDPVILGSAKPQLTTRLSKAPSSWQTWPQFLYQVATILYVKNTCFLVPEFDEYGEKVGVFPITPHRWELVDYGGEAWLRFYFDGNKRKAIELRHVGILTRFQYDSELFGASNDALKSTLDLIAIQNKAIAESAKNSATFRFMARLGNFAQDKDVAKERQRFDTETFQQGEGGGVLLFPYQWADIKQIDSKSYTVDAEQSKLITTHVCNYFGVSEEIMQNKAYGDEWAAFYEGSTEWLSLNLSEAITRMFYTERERSFGAQIFFASNRMQYMSNADKLNVARDMADRGLMTRNEIRAIFNLPPLDGPLGNSLPARGEYYNVNEEPTTEEVQTDASTP